MSNELETENVKLRRLVKLLTRELASALGAVAMHRARRPRSFRTVTLRYK